MCLPLLDGSAAAGSGGPPPCLGTLTVAFPGDADITGAALKAALLLARALVMEQGQALRDMATLVTSLLLPPPPQSGGADAGGSGDEGGSGGSDFSGSDLDDLDDANAWESSGGESEEAQQQDTLRPRQRHRGGAPAAQHAASSAAAASGSLPRQGRLLAYRDPALERRFAAYHASHMSGVDAAAYFICLCFYL